MSMHFPDSGGGGIADFSVPQSNIDAWNAWQANHPESHASSVSVSAGPTSTGHRARHSSGHSRARAHASTRKPAAQGYSYAHAHHLPAGVEDQRF